MDQNRETSNLELCNQLEKGEVVTTVDLENADSPLDHMRAQFHQFGFLFDSFLSEHSLSGENFNFKTYVMLTNRIIGLSTYYSTPSKNQRLLANY